MTAMWKEKKYLIDQSANVTTTSSCPVQSQEPRKSARSPTWQGSSYFCHLFIFPRYIMSSCTGNESAEIQTGTHMGVQHHKW